MTDTRTYRDTDGGAKSRYGLGSPVTSTIRSRIDECAELLEVDDDAEFGMADLDMSQATFRILVGHGAIERVGWHTGPKDTHRYTVARGVREYIRERLATRTQLPCGHGGFVNLRDGAYSCSEPECEREYTRETVERVFGNE